MDAEEPRKPLRILSLDGGGVRGLSSLLILQALLSQEGTSEPSLRPCDVFDLICGTSAGGLIALMLGRLKMVYPHRLRVVLRF
jgi:patatin-like phospholipase/acyl hydrolase